MKADQQSLGGIPDLQDLARLGAQRQRPIQNINIDGSFELGWGTALLCLSLVPYFNTVLPKSVWTSWWASWVGYLPLICGAFAPYAVPKMVKRFITRPRTRYVVSPNELKLLQLVMLMIFGAALGISLSLPFIMASEIYAAMNQTGPQVDLQTMIRQATDVLLCGAVAVYLGRKVIGKRSASPGTSDAGLINELGQSAEGRRRLRLVRGTLFVVIVGIPFLVCGLVFGLVYLSHSVMRYTEFQWPQLGIASFLVGTNAVLYVQGNAMAIKQHRWKWLVVVALLIGPIVVAPFIPIPAREPELTSIFEQLPPVMMSIAIVWLLSGTATLLGFVRHNPIPLNKTP